jgi:ferredoxin-type protein NapH
VAAGVVWLVFARLYAHYRAAHALEDPQLMAGWKGAVLAAFDREVSRLDDPEAFLDDWKGSIWSLRAGGLDITDPLAAVEATAASHGFHAPLWLQALFWIAVTLVLGRIFCSWVCPAGLLFEITGKLRKLLRLAEIRPGEVRFSHRNKYALLVVGLAVVALTSSPIFALVYPPAVVGRLAHAWIFGTALGGMVVLLAAIIAVELFVSPRWWCRTMCPGGALYALLGWKRILRVRLDASRCTACHECVPVCEPGIDPVHESEGIECDNCGVCLRHCPTFALRFTLARPRIRSKDARSLSDPPPDSRSKQGGRSHLGRQDDQPDGEPSPTAHHGQAGEGRMTSRSSRTKSVVTSLVAFVLLAAAAPAHHILGLPHYSYRENYPQAPTLEYPATTGPYDVLLTSYPGKPIPGESASLAFYIKNRETGKPFDQSITVRVLQTFTFGENREVLSATRVQPFEVPHKVNVTFPADGEYVVEMTMDVLGKPETIPFMMISGEPTATTSVLIAVGLGLALFIVVVRAIKIKRKRRMIEA